MRGGDRPAGGCGEFAEGVPAGPGEAEPRFDVLSFPGFAAAVKAADQRFFALARVRTGPRRSGPAHQRHRHLHQHSGQRARPDGADREPGRTTMIAPPLDSAARFDGAKEPASAATTLDSYVPLLGGEVDELRALAKPLAGKEVTMVNTTRVGGGVAELLNRVVPLLEELGLRPRWEVIAGDEDFFEVTKAFHQALEGSPVPLPADAFEIFRSYNDYNRSRMHLDSEFMV